jgi:hypothetical protein
MEFKKAGVIWTYPKECFPLEGIKVIFEWDKLNGQKVCFEIIDGNHEIYFKKEAKSKKGKAEVNIIAGRSPGVHYIKATTYLSGNKTYVRYGSFRLNVGTKILTDNEKINELFKFLRDGILLSIDKVKINGIPVTYYKTGDNSWENVAYPSYGVLAMRYFITDIKSMFDILYENQWPDGKLPDHIYGDGHKDFHLRKLRSIMADIETVSVSLIYKSWQAHGDDLWLKKLLPKMEAGIFYITENPLTFDEKYKLIKRPHTCDMWDVQIIDDSCFFTKNSRFVLMQGDTSAIFEACHFLSKIYEIFGNKARAEFWKYQKEYYYKKGNEIFWDGKKYKHHIHLNKIDHGDFNEDEQLSMSNVFAITRGFADHEKAISIIKEYFKKLKETKSKFPWWSLLPGYPDKLKYFKTTYLWSKKEGEYCNGGLFPLVGGELCRGCFYHGMEKYGVKLLFDFHSIVKKYNGAVFTWYYRNGVPGINAPHHQTNYDMWGITPWFQSLIEGIGGIESVGKIFNEVLCSPKWLSARIKKAYVVSYFPSSETYFSYKYIFSKNKIDIYYTGTGEKVFFHILLPSQKEIKKCIIDGKNKDFSIKKIESSKYIDFETEIKGIHHIEIL